MALISSMKAVLVKKVMGVVAAVVVLSAFVFSQFNSRPSYQRLADENEELREQLAAIHSDVEDAQSEIETLKSDIDDVQSTANECEDCDDVQSAASDLDAPINDLESSLDEIENKSHGD